MALKTTPMSSAIQPLSHEYGPVFKDFRAYAPMAKAPALFPNQTVAEPGPPPAATPTGNHSTGREYGSLAIHFIKIVLGSISGAIGSHASSQSPFLGALGLQVFFNSIESFLIAGLISAKNPVSAKLLEWTHTLQHGGQRKPVQEMSVQERENTLPLVTMLITIVAGQLQSLGNLIMGNKNRQALLASGQEVFKLRDFITRIYKIPFELIEEKSIEAMMRAVPVKGKVLARMVQEFMSHNAVVRFAQRNPWSTFVFSFVNCAFWGYMQGLAAQKAGKAARNYEQSRHIAGRG